MANDTNKKHLGSDLDDFLEGENALNECTSVAKKRVKKWKDTEVKQFCEDLLTSVREMKTK